MSKRNDTFKVEIDSNENTLLIYSDIPFSDNMLQKANVCPLFCNQEIGYLYLEFVREWDNRLGLLKDVKKEFRFWQYKKLLLDYY